MSQVLQQKAAVLEQKRGEVAKFLKDHTVNGEYVMNEGEIKELNDRNGELETLQAGFDALKSVHTIADRNDAFLKQFDVPADSHTHPSGGDSSKSTKSFGELFVESAAYTSKGKDAMLKVINFKTLMQTTDGFSPEIVRNRPVLLAGQPALTILDIIPVRPLTQTGIKYMEETPKVTVATETNEGTVYAEAEFDFEEKDSTVRKITVWVPVTDEQLEDVDYIASYLNQRLPLQIRQRFAAQALNGTGATVGGNATLRGLMNYVGLQTQAKGGDPVFDALLKAYTKIRLATGGYSNPTHTILNPVDEQNIRLTRTADGRYIMGDPSMQPVNLVIFGVLVVPAVQQTAGTSLTKDMSFAEMGIYRDINVQTTNSHADNFINGKQAVRADMRVLLHDYRPASGCTVTGL